MSKSNVQQPQSGFNYISKSSYFESKHKSRPAKFNSVVEGRNKRAERKSLHRKSARISTFDNARNMSPLVSPAPVSNEQGKSQRRRLLLQQWKEEKQKKKEEEANKKKKKPFVVGTVKAPLMFEPPPPPKPVITGCVTRSQSTKNKKNAPVPSKNPAPGSQGRVVIGSADFFARLAKVNDNATSFAPPNAGFRPPLIDLKLPASIITKDKSATNKIAKQAVTFDPIVKSSLTNKKKLTTSKPIQLTKVKKTDSVTETLKLPLQAAPQKILARATNKSQPNNFIQNTRSTRQNSKCSEKEKPIDVKSNAAKQSTTKVKVSPEVKAIPEVKVTEVVKKAKGTPKKKSNLEVPKSESEVEERLRTPEDKKKPSPELIGVSPCVTVSRGKKNARKETINKIKDGRLSEGSGDGKTANDFRNQLNSEISRLTIISDEWDQYSKDNILPDHIQELVLAAVGQTRLLMTKKLQQFSQLVEMCSSGQARPEGVITTSDLQGFWDMLFMQVEDVDTRFKRLSDLRDRQWVMEEQVVENLQNKKTTINSKKKIRAGPSSQIRAMIEAARKAAHSKSQLVVETDATESKHFEAGFFSVISPVKKAALPRTPVSNKQSMLKDVLSSEAKRANSNSPCLSPLINLDATPARSILKTPQQRSTRRKSAKTVLFQDKTGAPESDACATLSHAPPEEEAQQDTKRDSASRRTRKSAADQENVTPADSPPRRMTRNMRRSILRENQDLGALDLRAELEGKKGRRSRNARSSGHVTEVH